MANDATYWIHFSMPAGNPGGQYDITSDDGVVVFFDDHDQAIEWCEASGETYYDNTSD